MLRLGGDFDSGSGPTLCLARFLIRLNSPGASSDGGKFVYNLTPNMMNASARIFPILLFASLAAAQSTFTNPLLPSGPDPWVEYHDGVYYYMNTTATNLTLWKTRNLADFKYAEKDAVWTDAAAGPDSHDILPPEIDFLAGTWYNHFGGEGN